MPFRLPADTPRRDAPHRVSQSEVQAWALDEDAIDRARRDPSRLRLVASLGLLTPGIDEPLDQLVRLARVLLDAPAAFLGVSAGEEDFYKSVDGVGEPLASERRLAGRTFCHYTLAAGRTLALTDTLGLGPPWSEVPTVRSLGVRAYLGSPVRLDGKVVGTLCVIDVAPREWSERDVAILDALSASYQRELEYRVALAAWKELAEERADLIQHGERMVTSLAYDLRTPLVVTQLCAATLDRRATERVARDIAPRLRGASDSMRELIAALQNHGFEPTAGLCRPEPVSAGDLLIKVFHMFEPVAARNGVLLQLGEVCDASVMVDLAQGLRALSNVLSNALKFTPEGRHVTLQAVRVSAPTGRDGGGKWVTLTVTDEGEGMGDDEIDQCTQRGWKGQAGLAKGVGDGLGLAIVREIVERHGGKLRLESRAGEGTRVSLALPEARSLAATPMDQLHASHGSEEPAAPQR